MFTSDPNGMVCVDPCLYADFSGGSDGKESTCSAGDPASVPGQEDPLEKGMATYSSILAWRIPGTGAWWAAIYGVAQSPTRLT